MNMMHKTPTNMAHAEPFCKVVLLFRKKMTAVKPNNAMANAVTTQIMNLGRKSANNMRIKLSPVDIRTPHNRKSMALCEFHLS